MKTAILLLLAAWPAHLIAGPRTSASYSILAETADTGGLRTTSANYTSDGSAGGVAGISTVALPAQIAKHGYVAQLFEITDFVINAAAPSVAEADTLQLGAWQLLDDATYLSVAPTEVTWEVVVGPITGISAEGVASAGLVYQDTLATVRGTLGTDDYAIGITVLDTLPDNFGLYAGDGLGDGWQVQYFGLENPLAAPAQNPDGDAHDNYFEFIAGLDPTNANSVFRLRIENVAGQPAQKRLIFSPRLTDRAYVVKMRPSLLTGSYLPLVSFTFSDSGPERTVTDLNATGSAKFYTVEITRP